jgi:hypothetical protein
MATFINFTYQIFVHPFFQKQPIHGKKERWPFVGISCKRRFSMDRRDWELLDKQLQGSVPSRRNDGVPVLMVAAVFFSGMIIGGILFAPEAQPMRVASNHATAVMACDDNGTCRIRSHPPAGSVALWHFSRLG